jgi:hypothetical protein
VLAGADGTVALVDDWGAFWRQFEDVAGLLAVRCDEGWGVDWVAESIVTASGCVLIGLRVGREIPDWRLSGRLTVSELAAPERADSILEGSTVNVPGIRYFAGGNGLGAAEVIETLELSWPMSLRYAWSLDCDL